MESSDESATHPVPVLLSRPTNQLATTSAVAVATAAVGLVSPGPRQSGSIPKVFLPPPPGPVFVRVRGSRHLQDTHCSSDDPFVGDYRVGSLLPSVSVSGHGTDRPAHAVRGLENDHRGGAVRRGDTEGLRGRKSGDAGTQHRNVDRLRISLSQHREPSTLGSARDARRDGIEHCTAARGRARDRERGHPVALDQSRKAGKGPELPDQRDLRN